MNKARIMFYHQLIPITYKPIHQYLPKDAAFITFYIIHTLVVYELLSTCYELLYNKRLLGDKLCVLKQYKFLGLLNYECVSYQGIISKMVPLLKSVTFIEP